MSEEQQKLPSQDLPSDDELAEMISGGKKRKLKPDPDTPSPRLPEALFYFLFVLLECAMLIGVWGFMVQDPSDIAYGPNMEAPIFEQLSFHLSSMWHGLTIVITDKLWVPLICTGIGALVFQPDTPRKRKRMATIVSTIIVVVFVMLIAVQFKENMANAARMMP
ncbi:hypothetical protein OAU50_02560 [Planctomycetota bacterium]|nr:hypothetical protein [Planctomycetota bacterium]